MGFTIKNGVLLKYTEEEGVTEVVIPEGVTSIGGISFGAYNDHTPAGLAKWLASEKGYAFEDCKSITRVIIPYSVTSIGESAFRGCTNLRYVFIPESVTSIGPSAFKECENLRRIYLPDSITYIGVHAFLYCQNLQHVNIPRGLRSIALGTFSSCEQLTEIWIPESVTKIGFGAFKKCKKLERISIPESVVTIDGRILDDTPWMQRHTEEFVIINHVLIRYQGTDKTVVIPEGVTAVAEAAVPDCTRVRRVIVPPQVTVIGNGAFNGCQQLEKITIYGVDIIPSEMKDYDLCRAMEMLKAEEFEADVNPFVKYAVITGYWLKTKSRRAEAYIKANSGEVCRFLIEHENDAIVQLLLDGRMILQREHIDDLISYTIEKDLVDLRIALLHYKSEVLGYSDPEEMFRL